MKRICVFCGSSPGAKPEYSQTAKDLGATLALNGYELIYGGSDLGLMGVVAQSVLDNNGRVQWGQMRGASQYICFRRHRTHVPLHLFP